MTTGSMEGDEIKMDETEESSITTLATPPSNIDGKLQKAVDNYVSNSGQRLETKQGRIERTCFPSAFSSEQR